MQRSAAELKASATSFLRRPTLRAFGCAAKTLHPPQGVPSDRRLLIEDCRLRRVFLTFMRFVFELVRAALAVA
jgi:hypothetical protein